MAFIAAALLASCSDDKDYSGDFGQIKVPDTRQLEQTVSADDTQSARGVTFTTEGAWTSTIAETRAECRTPHELRMGRHPGELGRRHG